MLYAEDMQEEYMGRRTIRGYKYAGIRANKIIMPLNIKHNYFNRALLPPKNNLLLALRRSLVRSCGSYHFKH